MSTHTKQRIALELYCTPTGVPGQEEISLLRTSSGQAHIAPQYISFPPLLYTPSQEVDWWYLHEWLRNDGNFRDTNPFPHIPDVPGVYEVWGIWQGADERCYVGKAGWSNRRKPTAPNGLHKRILELIGDKNKTHGPGQKMLDELMAARHMSRDAVKHELKVRWTRSDDFERLEYALHLRYQPVFYDHKLFPDDIDTSPYDA